MSGLSSFSGLESVPMDITDLIILALATISIRQLILADRLTQWPRHKIVGFLDRAGGFIPFHILYWLGCIACLPIYIVAAFWFTREMYWTDDIAMIFAIRYLAQVIAIQFGDDENRDYPAGVFFPPDTPAQRRAQKVQEAIDAAALEVADDVELAPLPAE